MTRLVRLAAITGACVAMNAAIAQNAIPIRSLAPIEARSAATFGAVLGVRALASGRVLVDDARSRRLLLLDSTLSLLSVVLDSAAGQANSYGPLPVPIVAYLADSSLFPDVPTRALLVIDPEGKVARVMAPPNLSPTFSTVLFMVSSSPGVDNHGRLLFRGPTTALPTERGLPRDARSFKTDSVALLRADFQARTVDTVATLRNLNSQRIEFTAGANGRVTSTVSYTNPAPTGDEWAVLTDGSVAIVRGHDYHVDWIRPDGTTGASAKLPFDWKRLTDDDKQRMIDSARAAHNEAAKEGAEPGVVVSVGRETGVGRGAGGRGSSAGSGGSPPSVADRPVAPPTTHQEEFGPLADIPDYLPPIRAGAARADLDGNLWILPTTSAQSVAGELVYDVSNGRGELFERVRLPVGRTIAGFGRGGVVYLLDGNLRNGFYLERTRLK